MKNGMKIHHLLYLTTALLLAACSSDDAQTEEQAQTKRAPLVITSSINPFQGDEAPTTRANLEGTAFETGDWIKLKIICPYVPSTLVGETTWGNSADAFWLLKWSGSNWVRLENSDCIDISSRYQYGYNNVFGEFEAQQTPYIYTASTWNENVLFLAPNKAGGSLTRYSQYSHIFEADQSSATNHKKSDLLWAQSYMQTGSWNVHLSFNHVMACLKFTLSPTNFSFTNTPVVTVEGMPDIDQKEIVVGDYYAAASKVNTKYGYQEKCTCKYENNGKVIGVDSISDEAARALVCPLTGSPTDDNVTGTTILNTGVYKAYYDSLTKAYYLIVPPCRLEDEAKVWIRDGAKRFTYTLTRKTFEQGKLYPVTITLTE